MRIRGGSWPEEVVEEDSCGGAEAFLSAQCTRLSTVMYCANIVYNIAHYNVLYCVSILYNVVLYTVFYCRMHIVQ